MFDLESSSSTPEAGDKMVQVNQTWGSPTLKRRSMQGCTEYAAGCIKNLLQGYNDLAFEGPYCVLREQTRVQKIAIEA